MKYSDLDKNVLQLCTSCEQTDILPEKKQSRRTSALKTKTWYLCDKNQTVHQGVKIEIGYINIVLSKSKSCLSHMH